MITEKPFSNGAQEVLREIEKAAEKEFLPRLVRIKGKFWQRKFGRLSHGTLASH